MLRDGHEVGQAVADELELVHQLLLLLVVLGFSLLALEGGPGAVQSD